MADPQSVATAVAADLADERLIQHQGVSGYLRLQVNRLRSGDLGNLPVIMGLIVISLGFYSQNARFLSSRNLHDVLVLETREVDPVSLVRFNNVVLTRAAVSQFEEMLG